MEKDEINDSIHLDKNKIQMDIDIESKIKNYNKSLTYNSFNIEKSQVLENIKNKKIQSIERKTSMNLLINSIKNNNISNYNDTIATNEMLNSYNESSTSIHRKYSLEKRIRDFKKKITNDLNIENDDFLINFKKSESNISF